MTESIVYFEKKGRENTAKTIELAVREAKRLGIKKLVVASNAGGTALQIPEDCGLDVTVVSYAYGQKEPGNHPMTEETRKALNDRGYHIVHAAHTLSGVERSLSNTFDGVYPVEIIAHTLRMFSAGTKVSVEICAMAADAGYVTAGESVMAVAGTGSGADTAIVLRPEVSSKLLKTKIDRYICKPILD